MTDYIKSIRFFSMFVLLAIGIYILVYLKEKDYKDNGQIAYGTITSVQEKMGKVYYIYFFTVGDKKIKGTDFYYEDMYPDLTKREEEGLQIKVMYSEKDLGHSTMIFETN